jgi:hypothetical protein
VAISIIHIPVALLNHATGEFSNQYVADRATANSCCKGYNQNPERVKFSLRGSKLPAAAKLNVPSISMMLMKLSDTKTEIKGKLIRAIVRNANDLSSMLKLDCLFGN